MIGWLIAAVWLATPLVAQESAATVTFHFENPGLPVPVYTVTIHEDGSGSYAATYTGPSPAASRYGPAYAAAPVTTQISRPIVLTPGTTGQIFERVRSTDHFRGGCESKAKNIANTGAKTISYSGPGGPAQCTYNYTEIKAVEALTNTFEGIAATLDEGRALELKHKYDRLGLDHEITLLIDAIHDGRAVEVGTIAPVLQALRDDPQVLERVRKRAAGLLDANPPVR